MGEEVHAAVQQESWVTIASNDIEACAALTLLYSIKQSQSTRKSSILVSENVSSSLRQILLQEFDFSVEINNGLKHTDLIYSCWRLKCWQKIVFVSPDCLILTYSDDLFKLSETVVSDNGKSWFFVCSPNIMKYKELFKTHDKFFITKGKKEDPVSVGERVLNYCFKQWKWDMAQGREITNSSFALLKTVGRAKDAQIVYCIQRTCESSDSKKHPEMFSMDNHQKVSAAVLKKFSCLYGIEGSGRHVSDINNELPNSLAMRTESQDLNSDCIAIIGMSCRFPDANNPAEFWELLASGRDPLGRALKDRPQCVVSNEYGDCLRPAPIEQDTFECGFLKCAVDEFDASFFNISPLEAKFMDPQQRLLLEVSWEAIEAAGIDPTSLKGTPTSAYVGIHMQDYNKYLRPEGTQEFHYSYIGNCFSATASRISYFLGLTGSNLGIESGCASSLVAVHLACESLKCGESSLSLASGVNLILAGSKDESTLMAVLSPDFRCKTFDADANGFARAEGVATIVLKRMTDALRDGDNVLAVIRGTSMNNDGYGASFGTPNGNSQERCIKETLMKACVRPSEVSYVEAHGTGTAVGDPIEIRALTAAYSAKRMQPLLIGSVKSNIGHTESAAGIAGLVKVVLSLQHKAIPPNLHFRTLNPRIDLSSIPAIVPTSVTTWQSNHIPRIAGISSFSMSGTTAHAIVQEAPIIVSPNFKEATAEREQLVLISAKTETSLKSQLVRFIEFFSANPRLSLERVAFTSQVCRPHFAHRAAFVTTTVDKLIKALESNAASIAKVSGIKPKVAFLFTGQGSQYVGMGKELYYRSKAFQNALDEVGALYKTYLGADLLEIIWNTQDTRLDSTLYCQPAIFCVQYALNEHWKSLDIIPDFVVGHSVGEFAAAVVAGLLSLPAAIKLVVARSKLVEGLPGGRMLVLKASFKTIVDLIRTFEEKNDGCFIDIAADNSEREVVVSGTTGSINAFEKFVSPICKVKVVNAAHGFHSRLMDPILDEFGQLAAKYSSEGEICKKCMFISSTRKGTLLGKLDVTASNYWIDHLRRTVYFKDALRAVAKNDCSVYMEIGPSPVLIGLAMANIENNSSNTFCHTLQAGDRSQDWTNFLRTCSQLYSSGVEINWKRFWDLQMKPHLCRPHPLALPTYAFERHKFWFSANTGTVTKEAEIFTNGTSRLLPHSLLGPNIRTPLNETIYLNRLGFRGAKSELNYLQDHKIGSVIIFPAAGFIECCLAIGQNLMHVSGTPLVIQNLQIEAALQVPLPGDPPVLMETVVKNITKEDSHCYEITFNKPSAGTEGLNTKWKRHAVAYFTPSVPVPQNQIPLDICNLKSTLRNSDGENPDFYKKFSERGLEFGTMFRRISCVWANSNQILAQIELPQEIFDEDNGYTCHPVLIDAMIQTFAFLHEDQLDTNAEILQLPLSVGQFTWHGIQPTARTAYAYCPQISEADCSMFLYDNTGSELLATLSGVAFVNVRLDSFLRSLQQTKLPGIYQQVWRPALHPSSDFGPMKSWEISRSEVESMHQPNDNDERHDEERINHLCFYYILRAIQECGWPIGPNVVGQNLAASWATYLPVNLAKTQVHQTFISELVERGYLDNLSQKWLKPVPSIEECHHKITELESILRKETVDNISLEFAVHCGTHLLRILLGEIHPMSMLYPTDTKVVGGAKFQSETRSPNSREKIVNQVLRQQLKSISPARHAPLRIIEVGAGIGIMTTIFLEALTELHIPFEYTFTDISKQLIQEAKLKFSQYAERMVYQILDINDDTISQGFSPNYYNIVVSFHVLHLATYALSTVKHLGLLLRVGGHIYMWDYYKMPTFIKISFATLEGYWNFKDERKTSPLCKQRTWINLLTSAGFTGIEEIKKQESSESPIAGGLFATYTPLPLVANTDCKPTKTWILFTSNEQQDPLCDQLHQKLQFLGRRMIQVVHKSGVDSPIFKNNNQRWTIDFRVPHHFQTLISKFYNTNYGNVEPDTQKLEAICYFCKTELDMIQISKFTTIESIKEAQRIMCGGLLHLCQQLMFANILEQERNEKLKLKFVVVTRDVHNFGEDVPIGSINHATAWGLGKDFISENQLINTKLVDIQLRENGSSTAVLDSLITSIYGVEFSEQFVHIKADGLISFHRFAKMPTQTLSIQFPNTDRFTITAPASRLISDISVSAEHRRTSGHTLIDGDSDYSVEVLVKAVGLNFRDLMVVLKPEGYKTFLPVETIDCLGMDISGIVVHLGKKVKSLRIGDHVIGGTTQGLGSHANIHEKCLTKKPRGMSWVGGASIPCVYLTSYYSLIHIAAMSKHDRVLIHSAAGGVGISAIRLAQSAGATIFATAGTSKKREYLRSFFGLTHVYCSRDARFRENILQDTKGEGVTIVLNSLLDFKEATLDCCGNKAWFLEIGKLGIWTREHVHRLRPDVFYEAIDVYPAIQNGATDKIIPKYMAFLSEFLERDNMSVIDLPITTFPLAKIRDAFGYFQKSKHIGKIVIKMPELQIEGGKMFHVHRFFDPESTYMITGGLGGIGFEVAKWMLESGAKNLVLAGRRPPNKEQILSINQMNANIITLQADLSNYAKCEAMMQLVQQNPSLPPLRGIIVSSGVLSDSLIPNQSWDKFDEVFKSKIYAAINVHFCTLNLNLDFFTFFSSATAITGTIAQSNYAAACTYWDSLAQCRRAMGLPGASINWGPWSEVGLAANQRAGQWSSFGMKTLTPKQGLMALETFFLINYDQVTVCEYVDFNNLQTSFGLKNFFAEISDVEQKEQSAVATRETEQQLWNEVLKAETLEFRQEKLKILLEFVLKHSLKLNVVGNLDEHQELSTLGVDSLTAMELRNHLQKLLGPGRSLTANTVHDSPTIKRLATNLTHLLSQPDPVKNDTSLLELIKADCNLPSDILEMCGELKGISKCGKIKHVLLTGATGFVGSHVLHRLLTKTDVRVTCLLRDNSLEQGVSRIAHAFDIYKNPFIGTKKITVVLGNFELEKFGMEELVYNQLALDVDAVVHCGAKLHSLELYEASDREGSCRSANVLGLCDIIRFLLSGKVKSIYYTSYFNAVPKYTDRGFLSEEILTFADYTPELNNGYLISKFVGEVLLGQLIRHAPSVPCIILRFPVIWNNSFSGAYKHSVTHTASLLTACFQLRKFPDLNAQENGDNGGNGASELPIMFVRTVARLVVNLLQNGDNPEHGPYNLFTGTFLSWKCIKEVMEERGLPYEVLPLNEWREAIFEESNQANNLLARFKFLYETGKKEIRLFETHPLMKQKNHEASVSNVDGETFTLKMRRNILQDASVEKEPTIEEMLVDHYLSN